MQRSRYGVELRAIRVRVLVGVRTGVVGVALTRVEVLGVGVGRREEMLHAGGANELRGFARALAEEVLRQQWRLERVAPADLFGAGDEGVVCGGQADLAADDRHLLQLIEGVQRDLDAAARS